jgi:1-acyl-sn-glycerol-3-phosphate acyltransferase
VGSSDKNCGVSGFKICITVVMKILKEIFGRLLAFWALLIFVFTMLLFLIPFLFFVYFKPEPLKTIRFVRYSRWWMNIFYLLVGCSLKVKGNENFAPGLTYIVVCNHNSYFDVVIVSPRIPGGNKTIGKIEIASVPLFNLIYKTGAILVDRKSDRSRTESFVQMKAVLDMGLHMCIYPEGTRNRTKEPLKFFHNGAFKLSMDTGKSIIPTIIFNTKNVLPVNKTFFMWPQKMEMHFLPPVTLQPNEDLEGLKGRIFKIMSDYYEKGTVNNR